MNLYLASVYVPGYLPVTDERHVFHDPSAAWGFLAGERRADEEADDRTADYSDMVILLDHIAHGTHVHGSPDEISPTHHDGTGYVDADTPGHEGSPHDLGLRYAVTVWRHAAAPHHEGHLWSCEPCQYTCHGDGCVDRDATPCVHCAAVLTDEQSCDDTECMAMHYVYSLEG